jgi:diaminopimelate decarboxylase
LREPADVNALVPVLWSRSTFRDKASGVLTTAGLDVLDFAAEYGTPAYILDESDFRGRARDYLHAFGGIAADVAYAGKAFLCTEVARWLAEDGLGLDVCTGGELAVAIRGGVPAARLTMHGNNKSSAELTRAVEAGVGRIVVDSYEEIVRLADIADRHGVTQRVLVRITVGVEAHTHEYIATAHEDQKFGFSLASGAAAEAVRRILKLPSLTLTGLHSHIGSQIFDTQGFEVAARRALTLQAAIRDEHGIQLPELCLGGGFGIAYTTQDDPPSPTELALGIRAILDAECARLQLDVPRLSVEPGRAIAGPSTFTLYEVGTVKDVDGIRTYVSVDGGMSDNIRAALYDAAYSCTLASRRSDAAPILARVVGKHCESGDVLVRDEFLPADISAGDLLAVPGTGAYCWSMATTYNHLPRPPVVAVRDGAARVIVRRETEDDLFRLDL